MVNKELIGIWRNMLKPSISSWLLKTNYEGMGEQDKEEFGRDFDEILDLALIGLKYKAQLSQEGTTKDTTSDTISRHQAIDVIRAMQTYKLFAGDDLILVDQAGAMTELMMLPSAQTEEAIPVSWIEAKITQLISMDNEFAGLAVNIIKTLLNEWEREQKGRTDESN